MPLARARLSARRDLPPLNLHHPFDSLAFTRNFPTISSHSAKIFQEFQITSFLILAERGSTSSPYDHLFILVRILFIILFPVYFFCLDREEKILFAFLVCDKTPCHFIGIHNLD